jgi:hypothetical protein
MLIPASFLKKNCLPKIPAWLFPLLAALYFSAARVDIMDIDAAQYAEMSREMIHSTDYLQLYDHGMNYLDKPPMLFWLSSLSMHLFGVNNFSYRFPSILFALLALYTTYRLARLLYDEATGRMAALVLGVCQGLFLMTNDVRTDTILMGCVITAMWCIKECELRRRWYYVLGGCAAIACGLMTKGPIALFVPVFAFGADWLLKRNWKAIFNPWHLADVALILLLILPMCIGLYRQYDIHPEKWVENKQGISGLLFFFWVQSFGRITGESSWDNGADMSFLAVNMLWAFLPWMLLFFTALALNVRDLVKQRFHLPAKAEWVSTGGFILTYLSLSCSHYQLPHYIFVAFPLAAIVVAGMLRRFFIGEWARLFRVFTGIQLGISSLLFVGVLLILIVVFPVGRGGLALWGLAVAIWAFITWRTKAQTRILWTSATAMILINLFLTHHFYYKLLAYQAGSQVGRYIRVHNIPAERFVAWQMQDPLTAIDFYAQRALRNTNLVYLPAAPGDYVLTMDDGLAQLHAAGRRYRMVKTGRLFKVSELTPDFLNIKTRSYATRPYYLIQLL